MRNRRSRKQISKTTPKDRAIAARFKQTFEVLKERSDDELLEIIKTNIIPNYPKKDSYLSTLMDSESVELVDMKMSHTDRSALAYLQQQRKQQKEMQAVQSRLQDKNIRHETSFKDIDKNS